jgi:hypothetical protein
LTFSGLHGIISQKTVLSITTSVRPQILQSSNIVILICNTIYDSEWNFPLVPAHGQTISQHLYIN